MESRRGPSDIHSPVCLLLTLFAAAGCSVAVQAYPGAALPEDQIAVVETHASTAGMIGAAIISLPLSLIGGGSITTAWIDTVDGTELTWSETELFQSRVQLLPGRHTLRIAMHQSNPPRDDDDRPAEQYAHCSLVLEAEAGRIYYLTTDFEDDSERLTASISEHRDQPPNPVVAECRNWQTAVDAADSTP